MDDSAPPRRRERAFSLVDRAEGDPHRPRFHVVAPGGWLNDPNGLGQWQGTYHLFYQYNPYDAVHGRIHWGHATSRDLVTWTDQPVALTPGESLPDRDGCWSGVLVDDGGVPTLVYSGNRDGGQRPCLALGSPDLRAWRVHPGNPVIPEPPDGLALTGFRDHCVWREGGKWRQLIGAGLRGVGGTALLYESADLRDWRFVGPLVVGDAAEGSRGDDDWSGVMWECVDLFRPPPATRDAKARAGASPAASDVLVFSVCDELAPHHVLYLTGTYAGDTFEALRQHRLDLGGKCFYAPQSFADDAGRRVMIGWLQEERPQDQCVAAGWAGALSLPRQVELGGGRLWQVPVAEVATLRGAGRDTAARSLRLDEQLGLGWGDQLDVELVLRLAAGTRVEIRVRASPDDDECTVVELARAAAAESDQADGRDGADGGGAVALSLDRSRSSRAGPGDLPRRSGPVPAGDGEVDLRLVVDHSVLEVFANGIPLSSRVYPTRRDSLGVEVVLREGAARLERATSWPMSDTWPSARPLWPS